MLETHAFDVIHAHRTYDHWLARFAARDTSARLVRTFHVQRVLTADPFTKSLIQRGDAPCVNDTLREAAVVRESL